MYGKCMGNVWEMHGKSVGILRNSPQFAYKNFYRPKQALERLIPKTFCTVNEISSGFYTLFRHPLCILTLTAVIMGVSPDIVTNVAFGLVMVVIGIGGIWIVKWSTDRMADATRRQGKHHSVRPVLVFED
jgi:hypothetical protein